MTNHYYRDAHGALIVFDMTDPISFQGVVKWRDDIGKFELLSLSLLFSAGSHFVDRKMQPTPNVPTLVLANKVFLFIYLHASRFLLTSRLLHIRAI